MLPTVASYFFSVSAFRWLGGEHHPAQIASQFLEIVHQGPHRRLAFQPHQYPRAVCLVDRALFALWAGIARLERLVRHLDLLGARVSVGPVATVPFSRLFRAFPASVVKTDAASPLPSTVTAVEAVVASTAGSRESFLSSTTAAVFSVRR